MCSAGRKRVKAFSSELVLLQGGGRGGEIAMGQNLYQTFRVTDLNIGLYVSGRLSRYKVWREKMVRKSFYRRGHQIQFSRF